MNSIKVFVLIAVILISAVVIGGCSKKDPISPTNTAPPVLMPLAVGNKWVYNFDGYEPGNPVPTYNYIYSIELMEEVVNNNETWFRSQNILDQGGYVDTIIWYYSNSAEGLLLRTEMNDTTYFKLLFPADTGDTFTSAMEFLGPAIPATVISLDDAVSVPFGNYTCYHYRMDQSATFTVDEYYQPNVGWVKSVWLGFDAVQGWYTMATFELTGVQLH